MSASSFPRQSPEKMTRDKNGQYTEKKTTSVKIETPLAR